MNQENTVTIMSAYKIGDRDQRPWGNYIVTDLGINDAGEEFCEKTITINPGRILSLQSHDYRRETWTVQKGTLTALIDGCKFSLQEKEEITVPRKSIHCMANAGRIPCVIQERQEGICRENDIRRYLDAYGRQTEKPKHQGIKAGIDLYQMLIADIQNIAA
jgi:mannose-6-phosphate isomerase